MQEMTRSFQQFQVALQDANEATRQALIQSGHPHDTLPPTVGGLLPEPNGHWPGVGSGHQLSAQQQALAASALQPPTARPQGPHNRDRRNQQMQQAQHGGAVSRTYPPPNSRWHPQQGHGPLSTALPGAASPAPPSSGSGRRMKRITFKAFSRQFHELEKVRGGRERGS